MLYNNPIVSIVIPVYNGSNYLHEAIDSALAQTYNNVEIIVVNDGSTDDGKTEAIAKFYGDKIRYFYKKNGGVSSALNLGINNMSGDYFAWLSHDDIYLPQNIEFQISALQKNPSSKFSFCNTNVFYDSCQELYCRTFPKSNLSTDCIQGALFFFERWIYACSLLVHRSCFDKIGFVDENLKTSQDIDLTIRLLANFKAVNIKLPLALRRDHSESGFNTIRNVVRKEYDELLGTILAEKGLKYFFPDINNNISMAKAYNKLGDYVIYDSKKLPKMLYMQSKMCWLSFLNPSCYKLFLGIEITRVILKLKLSIDSRINKYLLCNS